MSPRTHLRRAGVATLLLAALAVPSATAAAKERPTGAGAQMQAIIDRAVDAPKSDIPGVALYVRQPGKPAWSGAAGKMRAGDRFRAGSIVKTFVAAATLQQVERGRLSLDAPLTSVLPPRITARFADADRITVRMLLDHTSGIGEFDPPALDRQALRDLRRRWTTAEFLDRAARAPRTGAPGEHFAYSNTDYTLLGLILGQVTGKSWRTVVRENVIDRAGLRHTSLPAPGTMPHGRDIARGYQFDRGRLRDVTDMDSSMAGPAGGHALLTTTADLSRFLRELLAGRLFAHPETLAQMRDFLPTPDEHGRVGYGLGLERYVLPGGAEIVGHMGTTAGFRAYMFHLTAQDVDIAMVTDRPVDPMPILAPALKALT